MTPHVLVIDNYDSFVYNLVQYLGESGAKTEVLRNDRIDIEGILERNPDGILLSPGPSAPEQAGICTSIVQHLGEKLPLLGVCLGHQVIGAALGGRVIRNHQILHGKPSLVHHHGQGVFAGLPSPFLAGRYHSLVVDRSSLPEHLQITAWTAEHEIMGIRHRQWDIEGVQFHPESILTDHGKWLLHNWLCRLSPRRHL